MPRARSADDGTAPRPPDGITSLLAVATGLEHVLGPYAAENWSHRAGIPAHVTVAGPWPSAAVPAPRAVFARLAASAAPRTLVFRRLGLLGDAVCLFPDPAPWLDRCRAQAIAAVGTPDGTDARWRPHLTLARLAEATEAAVAALAGRLPVALPCRVDDAALAVVTIAGGRARVTGVGRAGSR